MGFLHEKIAAAKAERDVKYIKFAEVWDKAVKAGLAAGKAVNPRPMTVVDADLSGRPVSGGKRYEVPEGVCGFAWVIVKPGNSSFAIWLKKNGYAKTDSYYGGVNIWISNFNQSYERKSACANALAQVLRDELNIKAWPGSRLD